MNELSIADLKAVIDFLKEQIQEQEKLSKTMDVSGIIKILNNQYSEVRLELSSRIRKLRNNN